MITTITRRLEFDAGHRVYGHEGKCAHVHGHRYAVELTCAADVLDDIGRVVDFSVIKERVGKWIDENLDHSMLLFKSDPLVDVWRLMGNPEGFTLLPEHPLMQVLMSAGAQKCHVMMDNPTAENIAKMIYRQACDLLASTGIKMVAVTVHETPNCYATYSE